MFVYFNPNPYGEHTEDCTVRAISKALSIPWKVAYIDLCFQGIRLGLMPDNKDSWGTLLRSYGAHRQVIPDRDYRYTVRDFATDHPYGTYIVATGSHVVCVQNGDYFDTWDSGNESPLYYWKMEDNA